MLVIDADPRDLKDVKQDDVEVRRMNADGPSDQLPPPYTPCVFEPPTERSAVPIASSSASGSPASPSVNRDRPLPPPPPPSIPFSNHLLIDRRNGSISGQYLIDTRLPEPSGSAVASNNLELRSHNGSVKGEVWIRGTPEKNKKATLKFLSHNGSVNAKIHSMTPATPLSLDFFSANGSMTLAIPCSFHGPLTLVSKHGSLSVSKALQTRAMLIREEGGQAVYHVQPPSDLEVSEGLERVPGESDARIESKNGSVKVRFEDEDWVASVAGGADGYGGAFGKFMRAFTG